MNNDQYKVIEGKNLFKVYSKYSIMEIKSDKYGFFEIILDNDSVERCKNIYWSINKHTNKKGNTTFFYATNSKKGLLHRFLSKARKGFEVDHINQNTLDNRNSNLRVVTSSQNKMNREKQSNNKSGYKGVCWVERFGKWMAHIRINKKQINLGYFESIEDAIKERKDAEKQYFGKYLPLGKTK